MAVPQQEKPPQQAPLSAPDSSPFTPPLEKSPYRNKDLARPKINELYFKKEKKASVEEVTSAETKEGPGSPSWKARVEEQKEGDSKRQARRGSEEMMSKQAHT